MVMQSNGSEVNMYTSLFHPKNFKYTNLLMHPLCIDSYTLQAEHGK